MNPNKRKGADGKTYSVRQNRAGNWYGYCAGKRVMAFCFDVAFLIAGSQGGGENSQGCQGGDMPSEASDWLATAGDPLTPSREYARERKLRGTQQHVADQLGVHQVTVARRESGAMEITTEAMLALKALPKFIKLYER